MVRHEPNEPCCGSASRDRAARCPNEPLGTTSRPTSPARRSPDRPEADVHDRRPSEGISPPNVQEARRVALHFALRQDALPFVASDPHVNDGRTLLHLLGGVRLAR